MPPSSPDAPRAPLRRRLDQLEELADTLPMGRAADPAAWDSTALAYLGDADDLAQLFHLALGLALRRGPADDPARPARLLSLAWRGVRAGQLRIADAVALRAGLLRLADEARQKEAWRAEVPLWWQPLPPPSRLETIWQSLDPSPDSPDSPAAPRLRLPDGAALRRALSRDTATENGLNSGVSEPATGWLHLDGFLASPLTTRLWLELAGLEPKTLGLERAGVAEGRLSTRRSDTVCYLDGRESVLLADAPTLAVLVQWLLSNVAPRLERALDRPVFAPERAMLACYPAPSFGYAPHLDNPGGEHDNGRDLTLVLYLNDRDDPCSGGEIALWHPGERSDQPPAGVFAATGGSAVLFDARRVPHQVRSLEAGPARWALTLWLADTPRRPPTLALPPRPSLDDLLAPIAEPPLPPTTVLFHRVEGQQADIASPGRFEAQRLAVPSTIDPSLAVVATVYDAAHLLDDWCAHHLDLGVTHLLLIFDHLEEPAEATLAERLRARWGERLTIWSGDDTAERRWPALPAAVCGPLLAAARRRGAADAVAARQSLNASAALTAFRQGLAVPAADWLLHLDADERLWLAGAGRGGASLGQHLAAAEAAGWQRLSYLVHELLEPPLEGQPSRYKINPQLARIRLGSNGWRRLVDQLDMAQDALRPYFRAHFNGKSAVRVESALAAAGVHSWLLVDEPISSVEASRRSAVLDGPWILHHHFGSTPAFRHKYRAMAQANSSGPRLFPPSTAEQAALALIDRLVAEGASETTIDQQLDALQRQMTTFRGSEIALLEAAGLLIELR